MLDNHKRLINYLRISVTDRCNLRCTYCMPSEQMTFLPKSDILTYEELIKLIALFSDLGITKLRFTGGEPFVRKDFITFLKSVSQSKLVDEIHITTNGVLVGKHLEDLKQLQISGLNISLDTIDPIKFKHITYRDNLVDVIETIKHASLLKIPLKLNMVVMENVNESEINNMIDFFKDYPLELRLIEYMPFNERDDHLIDWTADKILAHIQSSFPLVPIKNQRNSTSTSYQLKQYPLKIGTIAGYSRSFCGSCNRIRLSATGEMKTCLYGDSQLNLRDMIRQNVTDESIKTAIRSQINNRAIDGFAAEKRRSNSLLESMSKIGG